MVRQDYPPEQIAGTFKNENSDYPSLQFPHEIICLAIYLMHSGELGQR